MRHVLDGIKNEFFFIEVTSVKKQKWIIIMMMIKIRKNGMSWLQLKWDLKTL